MTQKRARMSMGIVKSLRVRWKLSKGKSAGRLTVGVEELTLSNTLQLTAIVKLLEERRILTHGLLNPRFQSLLRRMNFPE